MVKYELGYERIFKQFLLKAGLKRSSLSDVLQQ